MANEISISSEFLLDFQALARELEKKHPIKVELVKITGKRWSYIAGHTMVAHDCFARPLPLGKNLGLMVYFEGKLTMTDEEVAAHFKSLVEKK